MTPIPRHRATRIVARLGPMLLALGVAAGLDLLFMVEWTYPYCETQLDGPASAVFGFPFPELRDGASSLEFMFSPVFLAINIALRTIVVYATLRLLFRVHRAAEGSRITMGITGGVLAVIALARITFFVGLGLWQPLTTVMFDGDGYRPLRPSGIAFSLHENCAPLD